MSAKTGGTSPTARSCPSKSDEAWLESDSAIPAQFNVVITDKAQRLSENADPKNLTVRITKATTGAPQMPSSRNGVSGPNGKRRRVTIETRTPNSAATSQLSLASRGEPVLIACSRYEIIPRAAIDPPTRAATCVGLQIASKVPIFSTPYL